MENILAPQRSLYCPISVSNIVTVNTKLRQSSLKDFTHAQNPAYRAYCRAPGRPQTAAFGRVYFEQRESRTSPCKAEFGDCAVAQKAAIVARADSADDDKAAAKASSRAVRALTTERRLLSRSKSARRALRRSPEESSHEEVIPINDAHGPAAETPSISPEVDVVSVNALTEPESSSSVMEDESASIELPDIFTSTESPVSESSSRDQQLVVYHFMQNGPCKSGSTTRQIDEQAVSGKSEVGSCDQNNISCYNVDMQGEGYDSTPGLGSPDSMENKALKDLLLKQLSLSGQQYGQNDKSQEQNLESLNTLISRLINVKPASGYLYYFAYGPDMNINSFIKYIDRKPEESSWALLYGFKLSASCEQGAEQRWHSQWPRCEFRPQSAIEGRVYLISRQEADLLDERLGNKHGLLTVLLPVWLMDSDENGCSTAEHCLPALLHMLPQAILDC